jgi:alpha-L-rhamnosidase
MANLLGPEFAGRCDDEDRVRTYVLPQRILWQTECPSASVTNAACLLQNRNGQVTVGAQGYCVMENKGDRAGLLLDFGVEMNGGIQILAHSVENDCRSFKLRIRFGESVMEAMSEIGGDFNSTNEHAFRDSIIDVSAMGSTEFGNTGFRFVRIDLVEGDSIVIAEARAVFTHRDIAYSGSFECSDSLLNQIWQTGAYTVFLNMQSYLWDGIKRDRIVWIGDMHPETSTIQAVFGYNPIVPKSLDFVRDTTPLSQWMNGIASYSMWWVLLQHGWYMHNGDFNYLSQQKEYLVGLMTQLSAAVMPDGRSNPGGWTFMDWPSSPNTDASEAGVHALHTMSLETGAMLLREMGESDLAAKYEAVASRMRTYPRRHNGNKQAGALLVLAGLGDAIQTNSELLSVGGAKGLSSFYGYYVLQAKALAGDIVGCLDNIREYWGGMLSLGATSFWEDFDVEWLKNAARIDEITGDGRVDVHGAYGGFCYKGYRKSLCHGWASGPTAWLSEHVLGVKVVEPGCKTVRIQPRLGDLQWARGKYPTPFGVISVSHTKRPDGSIVTVIEKPDEVTVLQ